MADVLHTDDPTAEVVMPDGRVIRNLTAEEYQASLAEAAAADDGSHPHGPPPDVIAAALARLGED
ncbi:hypothetical protein [Nakamurella leprariae]|uniref:Uncharacterized protein n=1 Tax=Nakamurella leprariae TaxID=2803911 RepID=A0A939C1L3_9ACTN|nr:hypothetical protein [Nakamurella leprariae]MBM9467274.1 hypothetical protein [Nakamurella leprariae]